jgi:hypothetical protein
VGTRKPDGYGFGQNFKPIMGTGFLMGVNIFHGYRFGIAKPDGFVPVAISTYDVLIAYSFNDLLCCLRSEAKDILGDDWIQRHRRIVQQNANQYKRVAWAKVRGYKNIQRSCMTHYNFCLAA